MKRRIHLLLGGIAFLLFAGVAGKLVSPTSIPFLPGFVAALTGSLVPDCLEPPTTWHHRSICHSWRAVIFSGLLTLLAFGGVCLQYQKDTTPGFPVLWTISCFFLGYSIHLLADSCTKMGLPH